ncbi:hypothetical protein [Sporosarcina sp. G11-34]|nr:hypothetical protein [Sporosarcina sp. G11-34]MCZ2260833.1 hypothetical protein [Sporosarcina sp. G11-34]
MSKIEFKPIGVIMIDDKKLNQFILVGVIETITTEVVEAARDSLLIGIK